MGKKLTEYEFVARAIKKLRKPPYKWIHSVYSGFNQAFREYFNRDPVEATSKLVEEGKIATRPIKGVPSCICLKMPQVQKILRVF